MQNVFFVQICAFLSKDLPQSDSVADVREDLSLFHGQWTTIRRECLKGLKGLKDSKDVKGFKASKGL